MLFLAYPVEPYPVDAELLIQNIARENINAQMLFVKTETKLFTQNAYHIFYRDIYHHRTRVSHNKAACLESNLWQLCKFNFYKEKPCLETLWGFFCISCF